MKKTSFLPHCGAVASAILISSGLVSAQLAPRGGTEKLNESKDYQLKAASQIDKLIGGDFRKTKTAPMPKTTDEQFLRRTYLSIIGRIPSHDEAVAFLNDTATDKRTKLVDTLLDSDGYTSHGFNWMADMLRATDEFAQTSGAPYIRWVKDSMRTNRPFDEIVRDLLTAKGGGWEEGNGSVGYYVRDKGMPLDNMANTMRIFLGTRMECAQCHNHPFDEWKQLQFFEMAAFTSGLGGANDKVAYQIANDDDKPRELRDVARMIRYAVYDFSISDKGDGTIKLPEDYHYKDKDPGEMVEAKTVFGSKVKGSEMKAGTRNAFANWVTSKENPRFTKVIANRMWKRVMGRGLFEPVDNFAEAGPPSNPALMTFLEQLMKDLNYDLKAYQRVLYNTYVYQLSTNPTEVSTKDPFYFQGRLLDRLTAEQIWDSLMTLTVANVDSRQNNDYTGEIHWKGRPVLVGKKSMNQLYNDVIALNSGDEFWKYADNLLKEMNNDKGGRGKGNGGDDMMAMGGGSKNFGGQTRASELSSPTRPGHFLRQFGQSSREVIEGATKDSDVTQVLSIINGHVEKELVNNSSSELFKAVNKAGTPEEKIKSLFLSVLTRQPSPDEMAMMLEEVKASGDNAYKNIASALICTSEFMFMQ